jgi:hypothetical protein
MLTIHDKPNNQTTLAWIPEEFGIVETTANPAAGPPARQDASLSSSPDLTLEALGGPCLH